MSSTEETDRAFPLVLDMIKITRKMKKNEDIIMVVEDNLLNARLFKEFFNRHNIKNIIVHDGETAIDIVTKNVSIKMIFMDIGLPGIDGRETMVKIRAMGVQIPIIAQTAYVMSGQRALYELDDFNEYIAKPIDFKKLEKLINKYFYQKIPG